MAPRIDWARKKASTVLDELEIQSREHLSDLESICRMRGVGVRGDSLRNYEGLLLRDQRLIVYRETIRQEGRRRFTVAHELGHWEMHPGLNQIVACTSGDIHAYKGSDSELEANAFAAELLMPERFLSRDARFLSPTIETVKKLADRFSVSLSAAAIRLAEHSDLAIVVAFSSDGRLRWFERSRRAGDYYFMRIGAPLSGESLARYSLNSPSDPTVPEYVDTAAWFPEDRDKERFRILEESIELGDYGVTLSIITIED